MTFADVSPQLRLTVDPNPIPAGSTATLHYTVEATPTLYGKNSYFGTPVLNGKKADAPLEITTWTQENFGAITASQRDNGPIPYFETSTFNFGIVQKGEKVDITFKCTNKGIDAFHIYKADAESPALSLAAPPEDIEGSKKGSVRFTLDTSSLEKGENVIMVSLTTNSPLRPLVNLFVAVTLR